MMRFAAVTLLAALTVWCLNALQPSWGHPQRPPIPADLFVAVRAHWQTKPDRVRAFDVAYCESKFNRKAVSRTGDYGYFQVNRQAHGNWVDFGPRIFTAPYNVSIAKRLWSSGGWGGPWKWSRSCWS